jgi:hypothetical protein
MNFDFDVFCEKKKSCATLFWAWENSAYQHKAVVADAADEVADHAEIDYKHLAAGNHCNCSVYKVAHIRIAYAVDRISNFFFCYDLKNQIFF